MARMECDIVPLLLATASEKLCNQAVDWKKDAALTVVLAAKGYPGAYDKGSQIKNLEQVQAHDGVTLFHAGTKLKDDKITATGGRVLNVTATAPSVTEAQGLAYQAIDKIDWPEGFYRKDIGWRAVKRESKA
jgi:phosphoribosylamine--glycine ligase